MLLNLGISSVLTAAGAVATNPPATDDRPLVVATTTIWAEIVDRVDCTDHFDVHSLIPAGGDAHAYEPSMQDRDTLSGAALVVANGADLEELLEDTLESVADDGTTVFEVADHVTTQPMTAGDEDHESTTEGFRAAAPAHEGGGDDPHIWFDPTLVIEGLPALGDALVAAGADEAEIADCVATVTDELSDLDTQVSDILSVVPEESRLLVTNHDALGYFARHYGFEIIGSVLPSTSTLVEASPSELDDLAAAIEEQGVPAIFAEALEATDDATTLGDRLGVDIVTLYTDSLGGEGSGAETYADLMLFDAEAIASALAG